MSRNTESVHHENDDRQILAISYIPMQKSDFENLISGDETLVRGTVFPELYLPFMGERG